MAEEGAVLPDLNTLDGLWASAHLRAPFTSWSASQTRFRSQGIAISPVAGKPGTKADVIQVSAPFGGKIVRFTACRIGEPPIVPHSDPPNDNYVLTYEEVTTQTPLTDSDGQTKLYIVTGMYVYLALLPVLSDDGFAMGATPYDRTPAESNILGPQYFDKTLLRGDKDPQAIKNQTIVVPDQTQGLKG